MRRLAIAAPLVLLIACGHPAAPSSSITEVVILGDSVAHGAGDESGRGIAGALASITRAHVENLGINGARTANVLRQLKRADTIAAVRRAQLIVVSIGGNDLFGNSIERFRSLFAPRIASAIVAARVEHVLARIRAQNPYARIVLLGLYNPYRESNVGAFLDEQIALWDGGIITRFAKQRAINVIRIADLIDERSAISPIDHYHPSASGYRAIVERIRSAYVFGPRPVSAPRRDR